MNLVLGGLITLAVFISFDLSTRARSYGDQVTLARTEAEVDAISDAIRAWQGCVFLLALACIAGAVVLAVVAS